VKSDGQPFSSKNSTVKFFILKSTTCTSCPVLCPALIKIPDILSLLITLPRIPMQVHEGMYIPKVKLPQQCEAVKVKKQGIDSWAPQTFTNSG
jgi:hypothetical protein